MSVTQYGPLYYACRHCGSLELSVFDHFNETLYECESCSTVHQFNDLICVNFPPVGFFNRQQYLEIESRR